MNEQKFLAVVETALELKPGTVSLDSDMDSIEAWDSLGHLTILTALDKAIEGGIGGIVGLSEATSLREIFTKLS